MKNKKGFTLLELLVVVLIIGILAGIALPQYKMAVAKSRYATMMDLAKSIAQAQDRYFLIHNRYTDKFNNLDIEMPAGYTSRNDYYYAYKWGGCSIMWVNALVCHEYKYHTGIIVYLKNSSTYSYLKKGYYFCHAGSQDKNDFPNNLCKQLTGKQNSNLTDNYGFINKVYDGYLYKFGVY